MTNFSLLPTEAVAASESTSANLSEAVLVGGADILSVAPDPLLSRVLYLRASAACAIAKGNVITVAGSKHAPCTLYIHINSTSELGLLGDLGFCRKPTQSSVACR